MTAKPKLEIKHLFIMGDKEGNIYEPNSEWCSKKSVDALEKYYQDRKLKLIEKIKSTDYYHKIGKVDIWNSSNDEVVDLVQAAIVNDIIKELKKE